MKNNKLWLTAIFFLFIAGHLQAQKSKSDVSKHEQEVRDMVAFLQYMLNTLGDKNTSARDKDVLVTESFTKVFRDGKVQIEDDLDENRNVITNKDVQAYLKDVNFFFKDVKFEFNIESIKSSGSDKDKLFYKVNLTRNLKATTAEGKTINNTKPRFIEINYNAKDQDLKIVSIYTNEFNEKDALNNWWKGLSYEWQAIFKRRLNLRDSVTLNEMKAITAIESLDLSNNNYIINIEPLGHLLGLKILNVSATNVADLSPIRNLTELKELDVSHTEVRDLTALRYAENLTKLNIDHTRVTDISVLQKLVNLERLDMASVQATDFSKLQELTVLQQLNLESTPLNNLSWLSALIPLQILNVRNTEIQDLTALAGLKNMTLLILDSTRITDINALSNLKNLKELHINNTAVSSLSPLQGLTRMEKIYCDQTPVSPAEVNAFTSANPGVLLIFNSKDIKGWWDNLAMHWRNVFTSAARVSASPTKEELARVTNLDSINISGNRSFRSLEPLRRVNKLKVIIATNTSIADLTPLREHRNIRLLDISETPVSDLSPLAQFTQLQVLKADRTKIESIDTLSNIANLKKIFIDSTAIGDDLVRQYLLKNPESLIVYKTPELETWWNELDDQWKGIFQQQLAAEKQSLKENLHKLIELEVLKFKDVPVSELIPLGPFIRLQELHFSGTGVRNLSPLAKMETLRTLQINDNPVRDLGPVSQLSNISHLDVSNTPVEDLGFLRDLTSLKKLNCAGTQIKKLNALSGLRNLEHFDCSNTSVKKLDPIVGHNLKTLKCYNSRISKSQIEKFKKKNPECIVTHY